MRIPRSLGITAAIISIAAGAHVLGGGVFRPPGILAALGVVSVVPFTALPGHRFSFLVLHRPGSAGGLQVEMTPVGSGS